ncbi:MAG: hypothetical protein IJU96_06630 [Clostridia bacterium]|nr:hypothetical protein [Clostridia bacterium]
MKKLFCILTALALLAGGALPCLAVDFSCAVPTVKGGRKTELSLNVDESSNLYTAEFVLTYDAAAYRYTGKYAPGSACEGVSPYLEVSENEPGRIRIVYTATQPLTASGALCTLGFRAKRGAERGAFDLTAEHAETFDGEHIRKLSVTAVGAQGVIEPAANIVLPLGFALAVIGIALCVTALVLKKKKGKEAAQ